MHNTLSLTQVAGISAWFVTRSPHLFSKLAPLCHLQDHTFNAARLVRLDQCYPGHYIIGVSGQAAGIESSQAGILQSGRHRCLLDMQS